MKIKFFYYWKKYILSLFTSEREPWHIGYTKLTLDEVEERLIRIGYQPNYFSFQDSGQLTSMRVMYINDASEWWQKHIRFFDDGEVRGHDELSYEEDALAHKNGVGAKPIDDETLILIKAALDVY